MGKNNRDRRAAKARSRAARSQAARARSDTTRGPSWSTKGPQFSVDEAMTLLAGTAGKRSGGHPDAAHGCTMLEMMPAALVDQAAETMLTDLVGGRWADGWQPAELHRQGRRGCPTASGGRLVALAIAVDDAGRRASSLAGSWMAQIDELDLPSVNGRPGWIGPWAHDEALDRSTAVSTMVDAIANLWSLPPLEPLLPPPGSDGSAFDASTRSALSFLDEPAGGEIDPVLGRIRALLAKAESTTFEAEATALTAKAQELMTRHAIDAALLQGRSGRSGERPIMIRLPIDAPYVDAKCLLLQTIAAAGRCQAVAMTQLGMSTVVGFADDVAAVELLFTSLLLQAQTALAEAARLAPAGTRVRSQSYRSAFLQAYTGRIGQRLEEINAVVFAEADPDEAEAFLPVLRSRADQVDDVLDEHFGNLTSSRVRGGFDAAGWASGTVAGDNARLDSGELADPVAPGS